MKSERCVIGRRSVDLSTGIIDGHGTLRPRELALLRYLLAHRDRVVSGEELLEEVWGYRRGVRTKTLYSTIHRLREQLEEDPSRPVFVLAERGEGYRIALEEAPPAEPTLPAPVDVLIGREETLTLALRALDRARLVSLVGGPGFGKTRLAQQIGISCPAKIRWLAAREETLLLPSLVRLLGLSVAPNETDLPLVISRALRALGPCWLVVDDADRLAATERGALWDLLREVSLLRVLATVREPLAIPGEQLVEVGPLSLEESVRFICERLPGAAKLEERLLMRLAERMQGIPLALDLASAMIPTLGLPGLLEALEHSIETLDLAASPLRPGLSAAIARSWETLPETERRVLLGLTCFRGSFTLETAAAIFGPATVGAIAKLTRRSLLSVLPSDAAARYRLLDPIREALRAMTPEADLEEPELTYASWFYEETKRAEEIAAMQRIASDLPDFRQAIAIFDRRGRREDALQLTLWLTHRMPFDSHMGGLRVELDRCEASADNPQQISRISSARSRLLRLLGRALEAKQQAERALQCAVTPIERAVACIQIATTCTLLNEEDGILKASEILRALEPVIPAQIAMTGRIEIARGWLQIEPARVPQLLDEIDPNDPVIPENTRIYFDTLRALSQIGSDPPAAERGLREVLRRYHVANRHHNADQTRCALAHLLLRQGRAAEADQEMVQRFYTEQNIVLAILFSAWSSWLAADVEQCRSSLEEAVAAAVQKGNPPGEAIACAALAQLERREGHTREALLLLRRAAARDPFTRYERWEIVFRIEAGEPCAAPDGSDLAARCAAALLAAKAGGAPAKIVLPAIHEVSDRIGADLTERTIASMQR